MMGGRIGVGRLRRSGSARRPPRHTAVTRQAPPWRKLPPPRQHRRPPRRRLPSRLPGRTGIHFPVRVRAVPPFMAQPIKVQPHGDASDPSGYRSPSLGCPTTPTRGLMRMIMRGASAHAPKTAVRGVGGRHPRRRPPHPHRCRRRRPCCIRPPSGCRNHGSARADPCPPRLGHRPTSQRRRQSPPPPCLGPS